MAKFMPGHPKLGGKKRGTKNKATVERELLDRAAEALDSQAFWDARYPAMLRGRAPHLETYFLQRIKGKAAETVNVSGDVLMRWQTEDDDAST